MQELFVCQATIDKSVLITSSSNLTLMNLRFMRVKLLLIIRTLLSKVALQTSLYILPSITIFSKIYSDKILDRLGSRVDTIVHL